MDLDPNLVSGFDLIFISQDSPEQDTEKAEHLLNLSQAVENTKESTESISDDSITSTADYEDYEPPIEEECFQKYVVYAREHCNPTLTDAAKESLRDFYTTLRSRGEDSGSQIPVSDRKLESMIRLAEASARTRLSPTVEEADAERVIDLIRTSLEDVGVSPETGEFDADIVETGTARTQRERIQDLKGIIADIEAGSERGAPLDTVLERAKEMEMAESDTKEEIQKLKQRGELFEPKTDHLMTT